MIKGRYYRYKKAFQDTSQDCLLNDNTNNTDKKTGQKLESLYPISCMYIDFFVLFYCLYLHQELLSSHNYFIVFVFYFKYIYTCTPIHSIQSISISRNGFVHYHLSVYIVYFHIFTFQVFYI